MKTFIILIYLMTLYEGISASQKALSSLPQLWIDGKIPVPGVPTLRNYHPGLLPKNLTNPQTESLLYSRVCEFCYREEVKSDGERLDCFRTFFPECSLERLFHYQPTPFRVKPLISGAGERFLNADRLAYSILLRDNPSRIIPLVFAPGHGIVTKVFSENFDLVYWRDSGDETPVELFEVLLFSQNYPDFGSKEVRWTLIPSLYAFSGMLNLKLGQDAKHLVIRTVFPPNFKLQKALSEDPHFRHALIELFHLAKLHSNTFGRSFDVELFFSEIFPGCKVFRFSALDSQMIEAGEIELEIVPSEGQLLTFGEPCSIIQAVSSKAPSSRSNRIATMANGLSLFLDTVTYSARESGFAKVDAKIPYMTCLIIKMSGPSTSMADFSPEKSFLFSYCATYGMLFEAINAVDPVEQDILSRDVTPRIIETFLYFRFVVESQILRLRTESITKMDPDTHLDLKAGIQIIPRAIDHWMNLPMRKYEHPLERLSKVMFTFTGFFVFQNLFSFFSQMSFVTCGANGNGEFQLQQFLQIFFKWLVVKPTNSELEASLIKYLLHFGIKNSVETDYPSMRQNFGALFVAALDLHETFFPKACIERYRHAIQARFREFQVLTIPDAPLSTSLFLITDAAKTRMVLERNPRIITEGKRAFTEFSTKETCQLFTSPKLARKIINQDSRKSFHAFYPTVNLDAAQEMLRTKLLLHYAWRCPISIIPTSCDMILPVRSCTKALDFLSECKIKDCKIDWNRFISLVRTF